MTVLEIDLSLKVKIALQVKVKVTDASIQLQTILQMCSHAENLPKDPKKNKTKKTYNFCVSEV